MTYDVERLLRDFNVPFTTAGEHPHSTEGWANVHCPFCYGSREYHMGINLEHGACHCWRCGPHSTVETISKLLNMIPLNARNTLNEYKTTGAIITRKNTVEPKVSIHPFKFPKPYGQLQPSHKKYLAARNFDPDQLEREFSLVGTGPVSFLDGIPYNNRIIIPILWNDEIVSFQARDITDKSDRKYLACPMKREVIHHKNIIYGKQESWWKFNTIIITEGVTDVWRLGPAAVATFGIEFKMEQVLQLIKAGKRFHIIFDDEPQAQSQARKLAVKLKTLGKQAEVFQLEGDPGSMEQRDADHLVKELTSNIKGV